MQYHVRIIVRVLYIPRGVRILLILLGQRQASNTIVRFQVSHQLRIQAAMGVLCFWIVNVARSSHYCHARACTWLHYSNFEAVRHELNLGSIIVVNPLSLSASPRRYSLSAANNLNTIATPMQQFGVLEL